MGRPAKIALELVQYAQFSKRLWWKQWGVDGLGLPIKVPVDVTGHAMRLQVFESALAPAILDISTTSSAQGLITLGGTAGTIDLASPPSWTGTMLYGSFHYQLFDFDSLGVPTPFTYGPFRVWPGRPNA